MNDIRTTALDPTHSALIERIDNLSNLEYRDLILLLQDCRTALENDMTNTASIWLKGRPPAEGTRTLIQRLKAGMYDVPQSTAELLREAIAALEEKPKYQHDMNCGLHYGSATCTCARTKGWE